MKNLTLFWITFLFAGNALAAMQWSIEKNSLSPEQMQLTESLLSQAEETLPPIITEALASEKIQVILQNWDEKVIAAASFGSSPKIIINLKVINRLLTNPDFVNQPLEGLASHHHSWGEFIKASIVHEVGHLYDHWDPSTQSFSSKKQISSDNQFLNLAYFPTQGFVKDSSRNRSNFLDNRSPDYYEWKNPEEAFAVNLEYFLMDSQYQCRRPSMHQYLSNALQLNPFPNVSCDFTQYLMVMGLQDETSMATFQKIDPRRIYAVHYLYAGKGESSGSSYGHAMLRLVICAPERALGPDCLKDLRYHLVVSFRASINDMRMSLWKGIAGKYTSLEYIQPLMSIVKEYTRTELREILSYPLELNRNEIESVAHQILETHWNYRGKYKYFTNNCADETLSLLKRSIPGNTLLQKLSVTRPDALVTRLQSIGLSQLNPKDNLTQSTATGLYFPSKEFYFQGSIDILIRNQLLPAKQKVRDYLKLSPEKRTELLPRATQPSLTLQQKKSNVSAIYLLEDLALEQLEKKNLADAYEKLQDQVESNKGSDQGLNIEAMKRLVMQQAWLSAPSALLADKTGYGLPTNAEVTQILENPELKSTFQDILQVSKAERALLFQLTPEDQKKMVQEIKANLEQIKIIFADLTKN